MTKINFTIYLTQNAVEKVRNYVYHNPEYTIGSFIEYLIHKELENEIIEPRPEQLKRGRKI